MRRTVTLDGLSLSIDALHAVAEGASVTFADEVEPRVSKARTMVEQLAQTSEPIYGVNTGFGSLAKIRIPNDKLHELQRNIILSHAAGAGAPLSRKETRALLCLRLNVLIGGHSGVRFSLCEHLKNLLNNKIHPLVPEKGSVGASGDLAPLAHLALGVIGEGNSEVDGQIIPTKEALSAAQMKPLSLEAKEGLSLINGTQAMGAVGSLALNNALRLAALMDLAAAMTLEARRGVMTAYDDLIHLARGQHGQTISARRIRHLLHGSSLTSLTAPQDNVQDPYSLRCTPQVHGASMDALHFTREVVGRELNAATDNPLVFAEEEKILSGGNFHGQPLALGFDISTIAVAELANISERRIEQLLNPSYSKLPAFLTSEPGLQSGLMASQYLAASMVNENKVLSHPASTDSLPGNCNIEDHVSMGMTSALHFRQVVNNSFHVAAIEFLCAAQALDFLGPEKAAPKTQAVHKQLRALSPQLTKDRIISEDISVVTSSLLSGDFSSHV